jgi:hypothetical protein
MCFILDWPYIIFAVNTPNLQRLFLFTDCTFDMLVQAEQMGVSRSMQNKNAHNILFAKPAEKWLYGSMLLEVER